MSEINTSLSLTIIILNLFLEGSVVIASPEIDRAFVERIYHEHRTGTNQSFEETMPESLIQQLVEKDFHKEQVLQSIYGVSITKEQIQAEVHRINASTRAPEMLEEIKAALEHDPQRFAENPTYAPAIAESVPVTPGVKKICAMNSFSAINPPIFSEANFTYSN